MITADDFTFLRRAIDIAAAAITTGDDPYGSLLAGPQGEILIEAHNTVRRDSDITAHPELKLARWAARELGPGTAKVLVVANPCMGLDFGAVDFIHAQLLEARNRDVAILLLSEDFDELVALSDRLVVMAAGKIVYSAPINEIDRQLIGQKMASH